MKNDLIERYLYAVTKRMAPKIRDDVKKELEALIDDMLTERCSGELPTDKDIRVVLTELGSPRELYAKYDEDSKKCLIGQPYYSTYKFVLKIVLISAAAGLTIASMVLQLLEPVDWIAAAAQWGAQLWTGLLSAFAFVTLLFAFFYHKGIRLEDSFELNDLPPVPKKRQEISVWESVGNIALTVVFLVVFLVAPQIFCAVTENGGKLIPIFDTQVIRGGWYIIVLFALVGITRDGVKLLEKRYNQKVMVTTIIADIISAVLSFWWLADSNIINPEFKAQMHQLFTGDAEIIFRIFDNFNIFFLAVILFALVLDGVEAVVRTLRK